MFDTKYVVVNCKIPHLFICDMQHGIGYDNLVIAKSPVNVRVDGALTTYPANTAFYFPAYTPYYYNNSGIDTYTDYAIQFTHDKSFLTDSFLPAGQPIPLIDPARIFSLIELIAYENISESIHRNELVDSLMKTLMLKLHDCANYSGLSPHFEELLNLRHDIYNNPEKNWTLQSIADKLHISPGYLHTIYKNAFHTSCKQDMISSRISAAKHLLKYSSLTVYQIAYSCGYNDTEHFCRQFKSITGFTPLIYRRDNTSSPDTRRN